VTKSIKIYTIPTCSDCNYAKRFFKEKNIPYTDFDCTENVDYEEEVKTLTGKKIVPTIVIDDKVFIGFTDNIKEINELL